MYIYIYVYIYGRVFGVPTPPPYGSLGSTPFPSICKLLAAFLRSSLVFARSLQPFWLPAWHLLGTCYLLDDLRSTHTPSKYLRGSLWSYIHVLCLYFLFTTCVLSQRYMCLTYTVPTIHSNDTIHCKERRKMIRLTYWSSTIPNRLTYLTYHTYHPHNTNHSCIHFIPTIHTKHTIHSKHAIPDRPYTPYIPNNIPYHTPTTPQRGRDITMAGPWPWPRGALERWTILLLYIYI